MKKTTIIVVDDHKLVRDMWRELFSRSQDMELIGESGEFDDAINLIKNKRPEVVLLDINLSEASGFDAVPLIRKFSPITKVIAVSMHSQPAYAKRMFSLGAKAYVTKNSSREEVFKAVEEVVNGRTFICTEIKNILSEQILQSEKPGKPGINDLSLREIEIIKLIKEGLSSKEIGSKLNISARTAEVHRYNILKKLQLKNNS